MRFVTGTLHAELAEHAEPTLLCGFCAFCVVATAAAAADQIEDRPEVDEEGIVALSGEHLDAASKRLHRRGGERVVVRRGPRPDVVG
jgi:sugar/nucleoside kinase (ribokinase family)